MFNSAAPAVQPDYDLLQSQIANVLDGEHDLASNAAQFSAFIYETIADLNWAGFYFVRPAKNAGANKPSHELLVGPFQGKVACTRIPFGKGVCGTSALERRTVLVPDVHAFPGHIACDSASNAEIVIPLIKDGEIVGVFDIDSPSLNRFSKDDQDGLEKLVQIFVNGTDFK